jgi:site-specific DNA recombinase
MQETVRNLILQHNIPTSQLEKKAVYVRWSTDDQGQGHTLEVQLEGCFKFCRDHHINVNPDMIFVDDGYTGAELDRPGLDKIRELVAAGRIDGAFIYKLDRLSRRVKDICNLVLDEWDKTCYLISVTEPFIDTSTPMGIMILQMFGTFAEFEWNVIRQRTLGGKMKSAEQGLNPGIKAPYGYVNKDSRFVIVPEEAEIVIKIYDKCLSGKGRNAIAHSLNSLGIRFRDNKPWTESTVGHILRNPIYTGILTYGKTTQNRKRSRKPGTPSCQKNEKFIQVESSNIDLIIDRETFEQAQRILDSRNVYNTGLSGRAVASDHLLTGVGYCICGHRLGAKGHGSKQNKRYYKCQGATTKGRSFCDALSISEEEADVKVIARLEKDLIGVDRATLMEAYLQKNQAAVDIQRKAVEGLKKDLEALQINRDRADKDYLHGLKIDDYNRIVKICNEEIAALSLQLKQGEAALESAIASQEDTREVERIIQKFSHFSNLSVSDKKQIIRDLVEKIVIYTGPSRQEPIFDIVTKYPALEECRDEKP